MRKAIALNPALIQPDTIEIHDTIIINSFYGDTVYITTPDTALLDSILKRFEHLINKSLIDSIKTALQPIYTSFKDTLTGTWDDGNIITKIWMTNGKIGHSIKKLRKEVPYNRVLVRTKYKPMDCKTKPFDIGWGWIGIMILLFIALILGLLKR